MADEDLDLNLEDEEVNKVEKRIKTLSEKVKLTSEERDELAKAKEEEANLRQNAEKERDFYKNFNQISAKYPGATEFQDKILEKVNQGYDAEDAAISILAKEGKYTPEPPKQEDTKVSGGSASTNIVGEGNKTPDEMSQDERRQALEDLEAKGELKL